MSDLKSSILATLQMYIECVKSASWAVIRNWPMLIGVIAAFFLFEVAVDKLVFFGHAGRFGAGILAAALISVYYLWLAEAASGNTITLKRLPAFDWGLFLSIISVSFILYIIWLVTSPYQMQNAASAAIINLLIIFLFNAIPESIYLHRSESIAAFSKAINFTKENWIEWYLPFLLLLLPIFLRSSDPIAVLLSFSTMLAPLLPATVIIYSWSGVAAQWVPAPLALLCGLVIGNWFMLFRGFLFQELDSGSRRRRMFLAKQR
ncbi:MAG: hypothetical protein J5J00_07890 [Deltaproteobacteria bacterium]|nr:hypothetical protein [Deltaproteobacteria bacterium]